MVRVTFKRFITNLTFTIKPNFHNKTNLTVVTHTNALNTARGLAELYPYTYAALI